jgi:gamma-glutamyltranspeptidase/glutathione hydrolase
MGREILAQGAWTQGPVLLQALGMLAGFDLRALGHNSPGYIHVVSEALKLAFADRERYYGDSDKVPLAALLAPAYLKERAALIDVARAKPAAPEPGDPRRRGRTSGETPVARGEAVSAAADGTTHIAAIDRDGNMVCLTPSGGVFRKSAFSPELGCTLSTRSEMFVLEKGHPNALEGGKRPRTTLVSYMIVENGVPTTTIGLPRRRRPGPGRPPARAQYLVFGMNPQQAVEAPRFSTQTLVNSFWPRAYKPGQLNVEPPIAQSTRVELTALGHTVIEMGACGIGAIVARRDPASGVLSAGADPRRPTYALALSSRVRPLVADRSRVHDVDRVAQVQPLATPVWCERVGVDVDAAGGGGGAESRHGIAGELRSRRHLRQDPTAGMPKFQLSVAQALDLKPLLVHRSMVSPTEQR